MLDGLNRALFARESHLLLTPEIVGISAIFSERWKTVSSVRQATADAALLAIDSNLWGYSSVSTLFPWPPTKIHGTTKIFRTGKNAVVAETPMLYPAWNPENITSEIGDLSEVFYDTWRRPDGTLSYFWKQNSSYIFRKNGWELEITATSDFNEERIVYPNQKILGPLATKESEQFLIRIKLGDRNPLFLAKVITCPQGATTKNPFFPGKRDVVVRGDDLFITLAQALRM